MKNRLQSLLLYIQRFPLEAHQRHFRRRLRRYLLRAAQANPRRNVVHLLYAVELVEALVLGKLTNDVEIFVRYALEELL